MIAGILTGVPNCCSAYILSNLMIGTHFSEYRKRHGDAYYKQHVVVEKGFKFPDGYPANSIIAITNSGQTTLLGKDLQESDFVPVIKFESRYNKSMLTLWLRAKASNIEIVPPLIVTPEGKKRVQKKEAVKIS